VHGMKRDARLRVCHVNLSRLCLAVVFGLCDSARFSDGNDSGGVYRMLSKIFFAVAQPSSLRTQISQGVLLSLWPCFERERVNHNQ
jgi:hypothetical protein